MKRNYISQVTNLSLLFSYFVISITKLYINERKGPAQGTDDNNNHMRFFILDLEVRL